MSFEEWWLLFDNNPEFTYRYSPDNEITITSEELKEYCREAYETALEYQRQQHNLEAWERSTYD